MLQINFSDDRTYYKGKPTSRGMRNNRRDTHNWERFNQRLTEGERGICLKKLESMMDKASRRASALVVLHDAKKVREVAGSRGDLICCIVRGGKPHTWMMRGRTQMKKGCRERLNVAKILWHRSVRK